MSDVPEMIERVARRLAVQNGHDPDNMDAGPWYLALWVEEGDPLWMAYREPARELIVELLEPTEAMLDLEMPEIASDHGRMKRLCTWRAMVRAALGLRTTSP